jgi:deoxyribodipyrimidine photolyase-related protein
VWSHKARIAVFLSAMRHFGQRLRQTGYRVDYRQLDADENRGSLAAELEAAVQRWRPQQLVMVEAGEWRVAEALRAMARRLSVELKVLPDEHFLCTRRQFDEHAAGRKQLRLEYFYREMRRRLGVLLDGDQPEGGKWNYDVENRGSFGRDGPGDLPRPPAFPPDRLTADVLQLVERYFGDHPGSLANFDWPVTPEAAETALDDFIEHRLPSFGRYQDAMWTDEPFLYHSLLASAMNLKLLDPRVVVHRAERAYRSGRVPLAAAEGFIRQVLGWREYVRGVYWRFMPEYLQRNALEAEADLPGFYWTAETEANCLRQAVGQTLQYGYAHHIQRLMITGLYALLLGVRPQAVHQWYLAVYVDAVEWVELPNTLGMSQFADGGIMASKPYCASGRYIQRMGNYCATCRFDPAASEGERACPFSVLYWDFLMRHQKRLADNRRMTMQLRNLDRKDRAERSAIRRAAERLREP